VCCWPCILLQSLWVTNLTHNSFSYICLFQFSTCFERPSARHHENQLYQYDLWYMSLYVGDRVACITHGHLHTVTYTRGRIDTIDSSDDEHLVARNMYRIGINKYNKRNCASSWLFTRKDYKNIFPVAYPIALTEWTKANLYIYFRTMLWRRTRELS